MEPRRPYKYSEQEWHAIRGELTELYLDSNLPLKEVAHILTERHGFRATEKMYKTRLQMWGLRKNYRKREHAAIKLNTESVYSGSKASHQPATRLSGLTSPTAVSKQVGEAIPPLLPLPLTLDDQASDSGYSTGSSQGYFILVSEIASLLCYDEDVQLALARIADRSQTSEEIVGEIAPFLQYYGQDLNLISTEAAQLTAAGWVQQHARQIASALVHQFLTEASWQPAVTAEAERRFQAYFRTQIRSAAPPVGTGTSDSFYSGVPKSSSDQVEPLEGITLDDIQEFLISSEAFERFVSFLTRSIRWDASKAISDEIAADLQSPLSDYSDYMFHIDWDLDTFVREELLHESDEQDRLQHFKNTFIISGGGEAFYASSCQSYLRWLAPDTTDRLLSLLGVHYFGTSESSSPGLQLTLSAMSNGCSIRARGSGHLIEQLAKSLAFITAAIRVPVQGKIMISDVRFARTDANVYQLTCRRLQIPFWGVRATCWLPLVSGAVIAHNWPIPDGRDEIKGLELPFSLMKTLIGPTYPMRNQSGFFLQGYSRLLFPAQLLANNCVQWHMVSSPSRDDGLACDTILNHGRNQADDLVTLIGARTFLGFCGKMNVNLGTSTSLDDYSAIGHSQSQNEAHPLDFLLSSGTLGGGYKGFVNMSATMSMSFGKTLSSTTFQPETDYLDILRLASRRPLVLYDDHPHRGGRGWMVSMLSVILHMIHTLAAQEDELEKSIPTATCTWDSALAAKQLFISHANSVVRKVVETEDGTIIGKAKRMKDLVAEYWNQLTSLATVELLAGNERRPETGKLYGWDYMDVVMGKPHVRRKQVTFASNWLALTRDNLVLIGQDFGEVIVPDPATRVCRSWMAPHASGKQYLTACIKCLQTLSWERGDSQRGRSCSRLADDAFWHFDDPKLFGDCGDCLGAHHRGDAYFHCSKTPQFLSSSALIATRHRTPPPEGAVVFGQREASKLHKRHRSSSIRDAEEGRSRARPFIPENLPNAIGGQELGAENGAQG